MWNACFICSNDEVIKWKPFTHYWPFVRGIHRSPVNSPHKGQWRGTLMFSLICAWINGWVRLVIWDAIAPIMGIYCVCSFHLFISTLFFIFPTTKIATGYMKHDAAFTQLQHLNLTEFLLNGIVMKTEHIFIQGFMRWIGEKTYKPIMT